MGDEELARGPVEDPFPTVGNSVAFTSDVTMDPFADLGGFDPDLMTFMGA
jgi:hypothetical protein